MRLTAEFSHHVFTLSLPSFPFSSSPHCINYKMNRPVPLIVLSNPFVSKTLLKSHSFHKISRNHTVRASNLDDNEPLFSVQASGQEEHEHRKNKNRALSKNTDSPFIDKKHGRDLDSFLNMRVDFLEPMMLGIRPEFLDWPDQETVMWATIEQKAKSLDIPLSLRMIKEKLKREVGSADPKDSGYCSVKAAFSSMVFIIVELQSCALHMREALCAEDLESITSKVQKDMHSSFVWLFQQVFSRSPSLMLHVMILLANFGVHSASHSVEIWETSLSRALKDVLPIEEGQNRQYPLINSSLVTENGSEAVMEEKGKMPPSPEHSVVDPVDHFGSEEEMDLWDSMVDDATNMRDEKVLDDNTRLFFVSPVSAKLQPEGYENHLRTDLLYQMHLSLEPNNLLLLCNYAQFLYLVAHDNDRAEECFKRAVQVSPPDPESLTQYANFLWLVRKDYDRAEENFIEAIGIDPHNSYYSSRYANFLWDTGADDTCFPLEKPDL